MCVCVQFIKCDGDPSSIIIIDTGQDTCHRHLPLTTHLHTPPLFLTSHLSPSHIPGFFYLHQLENCYSNSRIGKDWKDFPTMMVMMSNVYSFWIHTDPSLVFFLQLATFPIGLMMIISRIMPSYISPLTPFNLSSLFHSFFQFHPRPRQISLPIYPLT